MNIYIYICSHMHISKQLCSNSGESSRWGAGGGGGGEEKKTVPKMQSFQSLCNLNAAAVPHIRFTFPFVSQHKAAACTLQVPLDYRLMLLPMPPHVTRVTRMTWIQTIKNSSSNTDICPQSPLQSADWCATLSTPPSLHYDARATSAGLLRGTIRTTSGWVQADGRATCSTLLLLELPPPPPPL